MPLIPNYPPNLTDEHHAWHRAGVHPEFPTRRFAQGEPGSGLEFLSFHRDFMARFRAWYNQQPFANPAAVAPWPAIPEELKRANLDGDSWSARADLQAAEDRIVHNLASFSSADELGIFVESGLHAWLHPASARAFNELVLNSLHSNESTYFYQLHGLIDLWWTQFQQRTFQFWQELDANPATVAITASGNQLYQLHNTGRIWRFTGTPLTGWQELDNNPATTTIVATDGQLYQLHNTGRIWRFTGTPLTGWQELDANPATVAIAAGGNQLYQRHNTGRIWRYTG